MPYKKTLISVVFSMSLFVNIICISAKASLDLGLGQSSVTAGHSALTIAGAVSWSNYALSAASTGMQTSLYYQSSYAVTLYKVWTSGDFLVGQISSGFGTGVFYSVRGFLDTTGSEEKKIDTGLGPAFRIQWLLGGPFYINLEAIFGLRDLGSHLTLNFQDFTTFSFGFKW